MTIDPSLARGFRRDLWRLVNDQADATRQQLLLIIKHHKRFMPFSEKAFKRFVEDVVASAPVSTLVLKKLEGRRQYVACMYLDYAPELELNEWKENVLVSYKDMFFRNSRDATVLLSTGRIGEHAIQRLFQRANNPTYADLKLDLSKYSDDVKAALAWSEVLGLAAIAVQTLHKKERRLSIFAPTPSGAFLGQLSSDTQWVELRTFVALGDMFDDQRKLWKLLNEFEAKVGLSQLGLLVAAHGIQRHSKAMKIVLELTRRLDAYPELAYRFEEQTSGE